MTTYYALTFIPRCVSTHLRDCIIIMHIVCVHDRIAYMPVPLLLSSTDPHRACRPFETTVDMLT